MYVGLKHMSLSLYHTHTQFCHSFFKQNKNGKELRLPSKRTLFISLVTEISFIISIHVKTYHVLPVRVIKKNQQQ